MSGSFNLYHPSGGSGGSSGASGIAFDGKRLVVTLADGTTAAVPTATTVTTAPTTALLGMTDPVGTTQLRNSPQPTSLAMTSI